MLVYISDKVKIMEGKHLNKLEEAIKGLKKPDLSCVEKASIKKSLLHSIQHENVSETSQLYPSLNKIKILILNISNSAAPNSVFRARLKETLITFTNNNKPVNLFARTLQKVTASALVALIALSAVTVYIADIPITKASKLSLITELNGEVEILRGGILLKAKPGIALMQGDIIVTGDNSYALIRYIDDSVSRLSSQSELRLSRLYQDEHKSSNTQVELELKRGRVWNQIVNLAGNDSTFRVEVNDLTAETSDKASFDIAAQDSKIIVFENRVQVSLPSKYNKMQLLVEGYSMDINNPQVEKTYINANEKNWVDENIQKDKQYKKEVEEENKEKNKEQAGLTPENPFYSAKKLNESTKLLLTTNPNDNAKLKIDIAIKRLNEAIVLLEAQNLQDAEPLLREFNSIIEEVSISVNSSEELKDYLQNAFADEEKDFSVTLPDSPIYLAKEALRDVKKNIVANDEEKKGILLKETEEKLIEVKELIKDDKEDLAAEKLAEVNVGVIDNATNEAERNNDNDLTEAQSNTLSTAKMLQDLVEEKGGNEDMALLAQVTHNLLDDGKDTDEVLHLASPVVEKPTVKYEKPIVSDTAVIMSLEN